MARRPVFVPGHASSTRLVSAVLVEFTWFPGLAATQKQRSIRSLHEAASRQGIAKVLEISSKSELALGVRLSAFNLPVATPSGALTTVESAFQASKVFRDGGPYLDLIRASPREAKTDPRLKSSGPLVAFRFDGEDWPLVPRTAFYNWLYLSGLRQSPDLAEGLLEYSGFTDIEFNPERSLNCQAAAAALFVALSRRGEIDGAMSNPSSFLLRLTDPVSEDT